MDKSSQRKVVEAGFTIIRCDDLPTPRIKEKNKQSLEWRTLAKCNTKAERDRIFNRLLESPVFIQD